MTFEGSNSVVNVVQIVGEESVSSVESVLEVNGQVIKSVDGVLDGGVLGVGSNLVQGLDGRLDEELVGSTHVLGLGRELLHEGSNGVLDLDERVVIKTSIVVTILSSREFFNGIFDEFKSILVVSNVSIVSSNEVVSFFFSIRKVILSSR